jgi:hypothetical protein
MKTARSKMILEISLLRRSEDGVVFNVNGILPRPEEVIDFLIGKCRLPAEAAAQDTATLGFAVGVPA